MQRHSCLQSFLKYITINPQTTSAVQRGTLYEYTTKHVLEKFNKNISLTRCGKTGDNGVDLIGTWTLPRSKKTLSLLVQCKSSMSKVNGRLFREMEGVHSFHIKNTKENGRTLLVVAAPSTMTQQAMSQFNCTEIPMVCCRIDRINLFWSRKLQTYDSSNFDNALKSIVPNFAAVRLFQSINSNFNFEV